VSKTFLGSREMLPPGAVFVRYTLRGTGNPDDDHEILGVSYYNALGQLMLSFGHVEEQSFGHVEEQ